MKRFNKNSLVFCFAVIFVITGFLGSTIHELSAFYSNVFSEMKSDGIKGQAAAVWNAMHESSDEKLFYYANLVDVNSVKENLLGTRVVDKGVTLVKTDSGKLHRVDDIRLTESDLQWSTKQIKMLQNVSEVSGAKFLYCGIPVKGYQESMPANVSDYSKDNYDDFLKALERQNIPYVDFYLEIMKKGVEESNIYFNSDHHWQIYPSFLAYQSLCEQLKNRYAFDYNHEYADLDSYSVKHYPKLFLGSWGQKLGTYFSWLGRDDFELIVPQYSTDFVESQPLKNESRVGTFKETFLNNYDGELQKNGFDSSLYDVYGGNFRLQIIQNKLIKNGIKVLMIRDSFAQPVSFFFATQVQEIHLCDVRNHMQFVGEKINMNEYISEIKPDYVIVLYSGAYSKERSFGYYDFF
jgi:hypothetical protein